MTGPILGVAAQSAVALVGSAVTGGAGATAARAAESGRNLLRLQGVVVAAGQGGPIVELEGGRVVLLEGAPALRPLSRVEVQLPSGRPPEGGEAVNASLFPRDAGGEPGTTSIPVRLRPAPAAPALLPARPGPVLPATLALADGSGNVVEVRLTVAPSGAPGEGPTPSATGQPMPLAAVLGELAGGAPVAALVLPARQGERAELDVGGGLVLRLGRDAVGDLPEGGSVLVRLVGTGRPDSGDAAAALSRALTEVAVERAATEGPYRLPADARLGTRLHALADVLERGAESGGGSGRNEPVGEAAAPAGAVRAVLGDPGDPATLLLTRERDAGGRSGGDAEAGHLVLDVTFARLGRFRIEVDRPGGVGGELRIALRGERPLPAGARADLFDLVGAAFEIGGARARFLVSTGDSLPPSPVREVVA